MKRTDLKKMLKPLVKQCVKEALLEEGVLSSIISEVVMGFKPLLTENKSSNTSPTNQDFSKQKKLLEQQKLELEEERQRTLKEQKIKILNATGFGADIFDDVKPLPSGGGSPGAAQPSSPLAGIEPSDAGIDISGIMALGDAGKKWNKLI